ncbi:hypothetical protein FUA48_04810 [Flavobacterium alkalisoli]|uniref:Uncharacterized protein n=1 Tax=Flavobacterium alkalisoli TaxID=2602769 RepID=A0A5B9FS27_9FLAO|nr:hypothetical protein [Flavobacterium alkalisoli]QEE48921.1 hypothetical protein FUA48_04810 [Flavobacterium alkalisoli]
MTPIIPYRKTTLHTSLTPEQAAERITEITNNKRILKSQKQHEYNNFWGTVEKDYFKIWRNINYRNSFLPVISGKIKKGRTGTDIKLRAKPSIIIIIFMTIWMGIVSIACIAITIAALNTPNLSDKISSDSFPALIPFIMFVFGGILFNVPFTIEYNIAVKKIKEALEIKEKV